MKDISTVPSNFFQSIVSLAPLTRIYSIFFQYFKYSQSFIFIFHIVLCLSREIYLSRIYAFCYLHFICHVIEYVHKPNKEVHYEKNKSSIT